MTSILADKSPTMTPTSSSTNTSTSSSSTSLPPIQSTSNQLPSQLQAANTNQQQSQALEDVTINNQNFELLSDIVRKNSMPTTNVSLKQNLNPSTSFSQSSKSQKYASKKPDYSDDNIKTPRKEQGLVIESIDGLKIKQYLEAIGAIVEPNNILYASRLSRDRICMYLKTKDLINDITKNYDFVTIEDHNLAIRPLVLRANKYYLNKVCPSIPSSLIHDKIESIGINITSMIQREKMNTEDNDYSHVLSFRRTFYGIPSKNVQIPESILLNYENENFRIFISSEIKRCSHCHKIGHLIDVCRQVETLNDQNDKTINDNEIISLTQNIDCMDVDLHLSSSSLNTETNEKEMIDLNDDIGNEYITIDNKKTKNMISKIGSHGKASNSTNPEAYSELEKVFNKVVKSKISFQSFVLFVTKLSRKKIEKDEIIKQYTHQIEELTEILETLRGTTQYGTKARITRTLYKVKQIFRLNKSKRENRKKEASCEGKDELNCDELEIISMEPVQFHSST